jgi:hypothetical protein
MRVKECNPQNYSILFYDLILSKTPHFSSLFLTFRFLSYLISLPPPFYRHPSYYHTQKVINTFLDEISRK